MSKVSSRGGYKRGGAGIVAGPTLTAVGQQISPFRTAPCSC